MVLVVMSLEYMVLRDVILFFISNYLYWLLLSFCFIWIGSVFRPILPCSCVHLANSAFLAIIVGCTLFDVLLLLFIFSMLITKLTIRLLLVKLLLFNVVITIWICYCLFFIISICASPTWTLFGACAAVGAFASLVFSLASSRYESLILSFLPF